MSDAVAMGRARRAAAKKIDYSKEQEFSDEDIFESDEEEPAPTARASTGRRSTNVRKSTNVRTSTDAASASALPHDVLPGHGSDEEGGGFSRPAYSEKGYDPKELPLRERFPFLPEYEEDGSPKIDLIVGRRPVDDKEDQEAKAAIDTDNDEETMALSDDDDDDNNAPKKRGKRGAAKKDKGKKQKGKTDSPQKNESSGPIEYEYLVKYKGRSYLHLEWKSGADLESMNKSAKGIYRRYIKKVAAGTEEDLENPEFDPSYIVPERVVDEADQEITIELTDKELLRWEKEREQEIEAEGDDDADDDSNNESDDIEQVPPRSDVTDLEKRAVVHAEELKIDTEAASADDWGDGELDFSNLPLDKLRAIVKRDGPYYLVVEGSNNPYRDGYVTEPPKKPRASYLFFQCTMRSYFAKRHPGATQAELMTKLGSTWQTLTEEDRAPFLQLAQEESKQYDKEKSLMEKAQRPTEVWQPLRRCRMVLERLAVDSFADIFLEPVDQNEFTDYEEIIDFPMDIGSIREKLENKKYIAPEQFARDMRRVWNNCKIYNQHGSAIWHVADYMSKQFERLYHAWVLEFRERYLRWADPKARPWEHSCRMHDGNCHTPDHEMVLCDHCDAMYGFKCVSPPMKKIPTRAWHCPDCKPKLKSVKGARMLSAVAENAARKRAELGDLPKKKVKQTMYLIKWAGLGYEYCTWETRDDVNDDGLIQSFQKLNNSFPDEADMPRETIEQFLDDAKHVNPDNAGGVASIPTLRSLLYSQTRSLQFAKCGIDLPETMFRHGGPKTHAVLTAVTPDGSDADTLKDHPHEVVECLADVVHRVDKSEMPSKTRSNTTMPPLMTGEYDVIVPITSKGLMMNVGEIHGSVAFLGYRQFPDGSKGPAEVASLVRSVGDKIIAVDGVPTVRKSFKEVIQMLRESGKQQFAYMRFIESRFAACDGDIASVGVRGRFAIEHIREKLSADRQKLTVYRKSLVEDNVLIEEDEEKSAKGDGDDSDAESEEGSEGEFQPESDDEDLVVTGTAKEIDHDELATNLNGTSADVSVPDEKKETDTRAADGVQAAIASNYSAPEEKGLPVVKGLLGKVETTRSLGYRLLGVDVGYSSDEGGDEDCAYFLDGVDGTFTNLDDVADLETQVTMAAKNKASAQESTIPARQNEFSSRGDRAKLVSAVALSTMPPGADDFDNFPYPSSKELAMQASNSARAGDDTDAQSKAKRSTVKVEQYSVTTGETIHIWANVESAAATLQIPLSELKQVLRGEYDDVLGDEVGGHRWRYALAGAKVTAGINNSGRGGGRKAKEAWLEFRDKLYDPSEPHIYKNGNRLRDYQVDGVNWLASTWYKKQGCILADEMGLGKTVQIICYIEHLYRVEKVRRPFLVVVPLSTIEHWRREFEGWTDLAFCVYHDRQRIWRDVLREYEWYYEDRPHTPEFLKFDVLVTTYDTLIGDFDVISQIAFRVAVVDEAHRLRNQKGKLLECMREISARGTMQHGYQSRVLMSGTPLQNDLTELWTLLSFIEPFNFPDHDEFQANFGNMNNQQQVENLQRMISPYMLRRVKEDVAKDIPAKEETVIDVELTSIQKQYYRAIFEHNHAFLSLGQGRQSQPKLMNIQMELRKVCNHPFLLEGVEHRETDRAFKEFQEKGAFDGITPEERQNILNEHGYIMSSGKMVLLDKLLPKLRAEGHKILIFSQMVRMLDLISEYMEYRDFKFERLDGRVRGTERQKAIDRFERDPDIFVFLLSTRAGGVGINLTAADICIIFDSDWNPQNDIQAQARCHRIGQTKDVRIYRLITSRSFEQEMFDRASKKLGLEQAVLGTFEKEKEDDKPSQREMEQLLKRGAYALLEDDNNEVTNEFCADDIESILAKRTRTRVVEGAKTSSWLNKNGMMVTKSKFSSEAGGADLDMDDPMFWQKVMPDFVTPSIMMDKLNELTEEIDGTRIKRKGRRGRRKKVIVEAKQDEVGTNDSENAGKETTEGVEVNEVPDADANKEDDAHQDDGYDNDDDGNDDPEDGLDALLADETLEEMPDEEDEESDAKPKEFQLSRGQLRKVNKFMSDLKSMLEGLFDESDEDMLSADEKDNCQKLLLTISIKEKIFSEEQRRLARVFLKRLEGDRRRRCRTSDQMRYQPTHDEETPSKIPELMIVGKKRRKRRTRQEIEADEAAAAERKRQKAAEASSSGGGYLGEDGYLHHSDSDMEGDWSDVGDTIYEVGASKDKISRKEAKRRRQWAADDDGLTAAGRPWPVFPRHVVNKVLTTVLHEVMAYDRKNGGLFSEPVPEDEFPEYYEQIEKPMDYSTMKKKLDNGEYRSAQGMQKDFILILSNCRQFNAPTSDIVKEARRQHVLRPKILKDAAIKHDLFIAEDGTVLEIFDEGKKSPKKPAKVRRKKKDDDQAESDENEANVPPGKKKKKKTAINAEENGDSGKPRIRIKKTSQIDVDEPIPKKGDKKRKKSDADEEDEAEEEFHVPRKKKKPNDDGDKSKKAKSAKRKSTEDTSGTDALMDPEKWQAERKNLEKKSFDTARAFLVSSGPWKLPSTVAADKFADVAKATLAKMGKHDRYSVFSEPVTEEAAPGYSEVVSNPMDFGTMRTKVTKGDYGKASAAAARLYEDFLLVFDNCKLYNPDDSEVLEEATRVLALLPETYATACASVAKKQG